MLLCSELGTYFRRDALETSSIKVNCQNCRLAYLCLPHGLQPVETSQLAAIVNERRPLRAGELLYLQGDHCLNLYAIKSGSFRSFITSPEGEEQTVGFYLPGEVMGFDSLQYGQFTCSSIALETAVICELPVLALNQLCQQFSSLQQQFMRILGKEIAADHAHILLLGHRSAKERLAAFLLMMSYRYTMLGFSGTRFNLTMSRHEIASFLGLTIETVSRQLAFLTQLGAITVKQRGIMINDLNFLKIIVNQHKDGDIAVR